VRRFHSFEFFSFAFMIGDSLSQDRMCGRYLAYANIPRLCHACNVTLEESENPNHDCNFLNMDDTNQKCKEAMKVMFPKEYDNNNAVLAMAAPALEQAQQDKLDKLQHLSQHMHEYVF